MIRTVHVHCGLNSEKNQPISMMIRDRFLAQSTMDSLRIRNTQSRGLPVLILIMTDTLMHQCRESRMNSVIIHITGYTILLTERSWTEPQSLPMRKKCFGL